MSDETPEAGGDRPPAPRPTDAELAILRVLWRLGPATVRRVHEVLAAESTAVPVGYTTVLKLLQIMAEKGLVDRDETARAHVYTPRDPAARTQRRLVGDLLDRAFEGATGRLVMQALATRPTSAAEVAEIRRFLDRLERDHPDGDPGGGAAADAAPSELDAADDHNNLNRGTR